MLPDQLRHFWVTLGVLALLCVSILSPLKAEEGEALTPPQQAFLLWQHGYVLHLAGELEQAVRAFRRSLEIYPTAEAHTFLGWSLSQLGQLDDAIAECKRAIELDPEYGNPYNDIGVYLIELGRADEAVPWLRKAMEASRYCCYEFPHFNLGRILLMKGRVEEAKRLFEGALSHNPDYLPARRVLELLREMERKVI